MLEELQSIVHSVENEHLKNLLESFLRDHDLIFALSHCPAGKSLHHAYIGGLLEHILSLCELARSIAGRYQKLNLDLLLAAMPRTFAQAASSAAAATDAAARPVRSDDFDEEDCNWTEAMPVSRLSGPWERQK